MGRIENYFHVFGLGATIGGWIVSHSATGNTGWENELEERVSLLLDMVNLNCLWSYQEEMFQK